MAKAKTSMEMMADAVAPTKSDKVKATPPNRPVAEGTAKTGDSKPEIANANDTSKAIAEVAAAKRDEAAADAPKGKKEKDAGPVKIETCQQLLKALWSSRGKVYLAVDSFPVPLAVEKSVMTDYLKNVAVATDPAPYDLVPRANETASDLIPRKK